MQSIVKLCGAPLLLMFVCLTIAAPVQAQQRESLSGPLNISLPYERFVLDNGLRVIVHEDRTAPLISFQIVYEVGSKDEPEGKTGFAHLFEHLMFNGSEHSNDDIFIPLREMGAFDINGTTSNDRTNYYATVPTAAFERLLFLESDRMGHLLGAVDQKKLDAQIGVVKNEKKLGDGSPYGRVWYEITENLFPAGHPYRHQTIGSISDIENATLKDVKDWFTKYYGAANTFIVLAGDIDAAEARELIEKYFGHMPPGPPLTKAQHHATSLSVNKSGKMYDRVGLPRIYRSYIAPRRGDDDYEDITLAVKTLGGGKNSRLHKRLVEELELATQVDIAHFGNLLSGLFVVIVTANDEDNVSKIQEILDAELNKFAADGPTRAELALAKTAHLTPLVRSLEPLGVKNIVLSEGELYHGNPGHFADRFMKDLQAATVQSVAESAARVIEGNYYELIVAPFPDYKGQDAAIDRTVGMPSLGNFGTASFPKLQTRMLSNGMKVIVAARDAAPVVELGLQFDAGSITSRLTSRDDKYGPPSVSGIAIEMLERGAGKRSAEEIALRKEELGASFIFNNWDDSTILWTASIEPNFVEALDLFADLVMRPNFSKAELRKVKDRMIDNLEVTKKIPEAVLSFNLSKELFGDSHPYSGFLSFEKTAKDIEALSVQDLKAWHQAWIRPDNATIFVAGDVEVDEVVKELEKKFGKWRAPKIPLLPKAVPDVPSANGPHTVVIDRKNMGQSFIGVGRLVKRETVFEETARNAMNEAFGGQFASRINMNIREEKGWSYGVSSFITNYREHAAFRVHAAVQEDRTGDTIAELIREIEDINASRPVSENELEQAQVSALRQQAGLFQTSATIMQEMLWNNNLGRALDFSATRADRYAALTLDDVRLASRETISTHDLVWVIVGDWDAIQGQVIDLDIGPIEVRRE